MLWLLGMLGERHSLASVNSIVNDAALTAKMADTLAHEPA
jgi:hypothetical protein